MNRSTYRMLVLQLGIACAVLQAGGGVLLADTPAFQRVFKEFCVECHGPSKQRGGLRFDQRAGAFAESDSGEAAIVPGDASKSELLRRVLSDDKIDVSIEWRVA